MNYIKFDTIESTNDFLKNYVKTKNPGNWFYVYADEQTRGKGQRANTWKSECCKNLLISYFVELNWPVEKQFLLNQIVSVSLIELLQKFNIPELKIKQPNDIMAGYYKIGGILIENSVAGKKLKNSVIGIGLNVNQTVFDKLPFAVSMKNIAGKDFDREILIDELTNLLKNNFKAGKKEIKEKFESFLYKPLAISNVLSNEN